MNINLMAPINPLGYGVVGSNILINLVNLGHNVTLFPIGQPTITSPHLAHIAKVAINKQGLCDYTAPCIKIWHQFSMAERIGKGIFYAYPIFELDTFSDIEQNHLRSTDHILVTSKWAKDVVSQNAISPSIPVDVVPLGVDTDIFHPNFMADNSKKCVFLNIGKWETRKGHDFLAGVFNDTFSRSDEVELWMLCTNPFYSKDENQWWEKIYLNTPLGEAGKIKIIQPVQTQQEVAKIIQLTTCGVFPSRAEGWNLEVLEMMACGKRVIVTNYSGHTEFCNRKNSFLIDIDQVEQAFGVQKDRQWFHGQGNWAKIGTKQVEHLKSHMNNVYHIWKSGADLTNNEGLQTARNFSWRKTTHKLLEVL